MPFTQLAFAAERRQDLAQVVRSLEQAVMLSDNPGVAQALAEAKLRAAGLTPKPGTILPKPR